MPPADRLSCSRPIVAPSAGAPPCPAAKDRARAPMTIMHTPRATQITSGAPMPYDKPQAIELSVVMPCLNEKDTTAPCIDKAMAAMNAHGIAGEIVVADNGSSDGSPDIARALGARVVAVAERG